MKICTKCKKIKFKSNFHVDKNTKDGYRTSCKICMKIYTRSKKCTLRASYSHQKSNSKLRGCIPPSYTIDEYIEWALAQPIYHVLHKNYIDSKYDRWLKPSADRIDDYKPYELSNLKLMTAKENLKKYCDNPIKSIGKAKTSPSVSQYTINETFIKSFTSITKAWQETGINAVSIKHVCNKKLKHAGGFIWKFN